MPPSAADPDLPLDAPSSSDADFLRTLGRRVREHRTQRGLTRKLLARQADVSERYLAQLEAGEGNSSIVLLRRVAAAVGVCLEELIADDEGSPERRLVRRFLEHLPPDRLEEVLLSLTREFAGTDGARQDRIALVGLRGAGKSTLGAALAASLDIPFVELDREVEREAGMTLAEIFALYGQSGYRRIERRALERVLDANPRAVIAAGGGIVSEGDTYHLLLQRCLTVWLRASPEEHMARVVAQGDLRPMAGNAEAMADLRRILEARESLYDKADVIVDTTHQTPARCLALLRRHIAPENALSHP